MAIPRSSAASTRGQNHGSGAPERVPRFWWAWVALQAISFVVAALLNPDLPDSWVGWVLWGGIAALVAWRLLRRSRLAWFIAVGFAAWGFLGGLMLITVLLEGEDDAAWFAWGLVDSILSLWILFSPEAKAWVRDPSEPAHPTPSS